MCARSSKGSLDCLKMLAAGLIGGCRDVGWLRAEADFGCCTKRFMRRRSVATSAGRVFSATKLLIAARYTRPSARAKLRRIS